MTTLRYSETVLKIFISKEEKITFNKAKYMIKKSRRMIQQNKATPVIIELEDSPRIDKSTLTFFNRVLCNNSSFPVAIINY